MAHNYQIRLVPDLHLFLGYSEMNVREEKRMKFGILFIFLALDTFAASLKAVSTHSGRTLLTVNRSGLGLGGKGADLCVVSDKTGAMGCGRISTANKDEFAVELSNSSGEWKVDESVAIYVNSEEGDRRLAAVEETTISLEGFPRNEVGVGVATGFSNMLFNLKYDYRIADHVTAGAKPSFAYNAGVDSSTSAIGVSLFVDYHINPYPYGFFGEAGVGFYSLKATNGTNSAISNPWSFYSTFGWRGKVTKSKFTIGVAAGFQYVSPTNTDVVTGFSGLMPLITAEAGFRF